MFDVKIYSYKKITKILKITGFVVLFISFLNYSFVIRDIKPLDKKNALVEFCAFVKNVSHMETLEQFKNFEKSREYCNNIDTYKGYFDLMNAGLPDEYSDDDLKLIILNYIIFFIGIIIISKGFLGLNIYKHFGLTNYEEFLFFWIQDLKDSKKLNNIEEFDNWMKGFESRYSNREIEIMKLNFKLGSL